MKAEEKLFTQLSALADYARMLVCFLELPTRQLAAGLVNGAFAADLRRIFTELGVDACIRDMLEQHILSLSTDVPLEKEVHILREEYTRLFTHPERAELSLYEAVFRYQQERNQQEAPLLFISPAAMDARRFYRDYGFAAADRMNVSDDHLARELGFLAYVLVHEAGTMYGGGDEITNWRECRNDFVRLHLSRWAGPFFKQCAQKAACPEYVFVGWLGLEYLHNINRLSLGCEKCYTQNNDFRVE